MQAGPIISLSPSFNSYSNSRLAEIAARVVEEFDSEEFYDEFYFEREEEEDPAARRVQTEEHSATQNSHADENSEHAGKEDVEEEDDDDGEFEFAFVARDSEFSSPISADEIFQNGQIRPVYPVFNRDLMLGGMKFQDQNDKESGVPDSDSDSLKGQKIRLPLRKLFVEERETTLTTSSSSSSEADELDGVPVDSYCVWQPKTAEERCKKSSSTGSISKRWKLKGLMNRSHSDGKDSFVFLSPSNSGRKKENELKVKETPVGGGKEKPAVPPLSPPSPYNRDGGEKRRSYLPYRQDLVGFFGNNVNGSSKYF